LRNKLAKVQPSVLTPDEGIPNSHLKAMFIDLLIIVKKSILIKKEITSMVLKDFGDI